MTVFENIDWDIVLFGSLWFGLFVVLPVCVYLVLRYVLTGRVRKYVILIAGLGGIALGAAMAIYPFANPPTDSGGLGIIILIPLGALLAIVCAGLLWLERRTRRSKS